jgi:hypothetical protein
MSLSAERISQLILDQLARGEMRVLSLVVAIRKSLAGSETVKGDLTAAVKSNLGKLIASKTVCEFEGIYALVSPA